MIRQQWVYLVEGKNGVKIFMDKVHEKCIYQNFHPIFTPTKHTLSFQVYNNDSITKKKFLSIKTVSGMLLV